MISQLTLLFSIFLALAALFLTIYLSNITDTSPQKKKRLIVYLIAAGVLVGLTGILGFFKFSDLQIGVFIGGLVWLVFIGGLQTWLYHKFFETGNANKVLLTLTIGFIGYALILLFYKLYFKNPFPWIFFLPLFCFLAPVFVQIAFGNFVRIPIKVFKAWDFPPPNSLSDPTDAEMDNLIIINFVIRRNTTDSHTVFKAKAPLGMKLGKLFYYFIMDYNSRHMDNPIALENETKTLFKWAFLIRSGIFGSLTHLDPELTISQNRLKENASVTCVRI